MIIAHEYIEQVINKTITDLTIMSARINKFHKREIST